MDVSEPLLSQQPPASVPYRMWMAVFAVTIQSFLFGYSYAALNPCLVLGSQNSAESCYDHSDTSCPSGTIYNNFNLSTIETSLANALLIIGAWISCLAVNHPSDRYGRRLTLLFNTFFFLLGATLCAVGNVYAFFIGRFITGVGVGVSSVLCPMLLSELADHSNRGLITTIHMVVVTCGIFLAGLLAYGFVGNIRRGWQYVFGFQLLPGLLAIFTSSYMPESPKWLVRQNRLAEANDILKAIRPKQHDCFGEIKEIQNETREEDDFSHATWKEVFRYRSPLLFGCGVMISQALTGVNSVILYSTTLFGYAGVSQTILATVSVGCVNVLATAASAYFVDKVGRKYLLLGGEYVMLVSIGVLATVLIVDTPNVVLQGVVAVLAVLLFMTGFAIGIGAVAWVILSEIVPSRVRAKAVSLFLCVNWGSNLLVSLMTLPAIDLLGKVNASSGEDKQAENKHGVASLFFIYFGMTVLAILFAVLILPETRGMNILTDTRFQPLLRSFDKNDNTHLYSVIANDLENGDASDNNNMGADKSNNKAAYNPMLGTLMVTNRIIIRSELDPLSNNKLPKNHVPFHE